MKRWLLYCGFGLGVISTVSIFVMLGMKEPGAELDPNQLQLREELGVQSGDRVYSTLRRMETWYPASEFENNKRIFDETRPGNISPDEYSEALETWSDEEAPQHATFQEFANRVSMILSPIEEEEPIQDITKGQYSDWLPVAKWDGKTSVRTDWYRPGAGAQGIRLKTRFLPPLGTPEWENQPIFEVTCFPGSGATPILLDRRTDGGTTIHEFNVKTAFYLEIAAQGEWEVSIEEQHTYATAKEFNRAVDNTSIVANQIALFEMQRQAQKEHDAVQRRKKVGTYAPTAPQNSDQPTIPIPRIQVPVMR